MENDFIERLRIFLACNAAQIRRQAMLNRLQLKDGEVMNIAENVIGSRPPTKPLPKFIINKPKSLIER